MKTYLSTFARSTRAFFLFCLQFFDDSLQAFCFLVGEVVSESDRKPLRGAAELLRDFPEGKPAAYNQGAYFFAAHSVTTFLYRLTTVFIFFSRCYAHCIEKQNCGRYTYYFFIFSLLVTIKTRLTYKNRNYTLMEKKKKKVGVTMSEQIKKTNTQEQEEAVTLDSMKQKQNVKIKVRLREVIEAWKKEGGAGNYLSDEAIAEQFQNDTGIVIQGRTVANYIKENNSNAVPLPFLCWCAEKRGVSVNYLITGKEYTPKEERKAESATVSDVLDSLQLLLETFGNVIEFSAYQKDVTICVPGETIDSFPRTFYSLEINSEEVQRHLYNWKRFDEVAKSRPNDDKEELKDILFDRDLEKAKSKYDSISKRTGVFYKADEQPAFVKPLSGSDAVCVAVPKKEMPYFADKFLRWERVVLEGIETFRAVTIPKRVTQDTYFSHDSMWDKSDIRKWEHEHRPPVELSQVTSHADDEDNKDNRDKKE